MGTIDRDHCGSRKSRRWLMLFLATMALSIITVRAVEWMMGEAAGASDAQAADAQDAKSKDVLNGRRQNLSASRVGRTQTGRRLPTERPGRRAALLDVRCSTVS